MSKKRILFFAEGITMTHFVRPAVLASSLAATQDWEVIFRTPDRYHHFLKNHAFHDLGGLRTADPAAFLDCLYRGRVAYPSETLRGYVKDDLDIIRDVRPDLVFGDFRLSLCISAPVSGVPFGSIYNAQWSRYHKHPAIVPETPITHWIPPVLLNPLFALLRPSIYADNAEHVNVVRREYGLPPIEDLRDIYTAGDLVIYPDIPEFVPFRGAPEHHHFVGHCNWVPATDRPPWWNEVMNANIPRVFVTMGSSGSVKALPAVLEAVSALPIQVLLSTSGRNVAVPPNVFTAALLPFEETARRCFAVISHGGTGALYPALAAGAPMLCIPNNIDNHVSSALMKANGVGVVVRVEHASVARLRRAVETLLEDGSFKARAECMAETMRRYDPTTIFPAIVRDWFKR